MYRICAVENHRTRTLTISGENEWKRLVDSQGADFLTVKLDNDALEDKNLKMDLADE